MTPHFLEKELACKCGCGMLPHQDFMDKVESLRIAFGEPMQVTRAASCPAHNQKVSTTGANGPHTTGRAIDIAVSGEAALRLVALAIEDGFTGIGVQQKGSARFIHIDDLPETPERPRPFIWSY